MTELLGIPRGVIWSTKRYLAAISCIFVLKLLEKMIFKGSLLISVTNTFNFLHSDAKAKRCDEKSPVISAD